MACVRINQNVHFAEVIMRQNQWVRLSEQRVNVSGKRKQGLRKAQCTSAVIAYLGLVIW